MTRYYAKYGKDADFVAEGIPIGIIENALKVMKQKGISRTDLAREIGVPKSQISRRFNAPPNLTLLSIARMAVALGVEPQALLNTDVAAKDEVSVPHTGR